MYDPFSTATKSRLRDGSKSIPISPFYVLPQRRHLLTSDQQYTLCGFADTGIVMDFGTFVGVHLNQMVWTERAHRDIVDAQLQEIGHYVTFEESKDNIFGVRFCEDCLRQFQGLHQAWWTFAPSYNRPQVKKIGMRNYGK